MDIVLELFDAFLFDPLYAFALPAPSPYSVLTSAKYPNGTTTTFSCMSEGPPVATFYRYRPSTTYFSIQPSRFACMSQWPRDNIYRQALSLFLITWLFGCVVYFVCAGLSYLFVFDKATFTHPKFLKSQIKMEIKQAVSSMPGMALLTAPFFLAEIQGYAHLYDSLSDAPFYWYNFLQFPLFLLFTDFCIYWIHRGLHHPLIYKHIHKAHHKWIMPSPFASHAFHPVDGWSQSLPYHIFPFIFPLQKFAYVALFIFINVWTVFIHDGEYISQSPVINGAACHTMHHLYFNFNFGQYTTLWDRLGGSYRKPNEELFRKETKMAKDEWERQAKEIEVLVKEVEGDDDRSYGHEAAKIQKKLL